MTQLCQAVESSSRDRRPVSHETLRESVLLVGQLPQRWVSLRRTLPSAAMRTSTARILSPSFSFTPSCVPGSPASAAIAQS